MSKQIRYNMYEAKTKLSELVNKVQTGIEIILMNRGKPVARITPFVSNRGPRKLGFAKDIKMLPGFDDIPEGFE